MSVIDARARFLQRQAEVGTSPARMCRYCSGSVTMMFFPRVDHRRRRPWPQVFGTCDGHLEQGERDCQAESHP